MGTCDETLQILSFETANAMSRLTALHDSLSDDEFNCLRNVTMKSRGVALLNSCDEGFLMNLACKEKLEELESVAVIVSRLGQKCSDPALRSFDLLFSNLKHGIVDTKNVRISSKNTRKIIKKLEKYVSETSNLRAALDSLAEMELSERKLQVWRRNIAPKLQTNGCYFDEQIGYQRKQVKHFQEISLWSEKLEKSVGLMARIICIIYARICELFGPFVTSLPRLTINKNRVHKVHPESDHCFFPHGHYKNHSHASRSHALSKSSLNNLLARIFGRDLRLPTKLEVDYCLLSDRDKHRGRGSKCSTLKPEQNNGPSMIGQEKYMPTYSENGKSQSQGLIHYASPSTVGGAGLALRYANIIMLAESYLYSPVEINNKEAREAFYEMLPAKLRRVIRRRLWRGSRRPEEEAKDWTAEVEEILTWLAPMAHDTVQWITERNLVMRKKLEVVKPTVMLLQTLHFSDLKVVEDAVADVLVGLSYVCWYRS